MTTRTLTGTYGGGYTLAASYSSLLLRPTALIEGEGLPVPAPATVTNPGSFLAGAGTGAGGTRHTGVPFKAVVGNHASRRASSPLRPEGKC